jgi:hypothetical protein
MKVMLGATAAVLLMASPALAQTPPAQTPASCLNLPAAPAVADGATASRDDMAESQQAVTAWNTDMEARLATCRADINTQVQALQAFFNAQDTARVTTYNQMAAETAEFNARGDTAGGNRRERGGVLTRPDH